MSFRFKALGWHLGASGVALTVILGTLYCGWYRWPGWYLADVTQVVFVMAGVDLVIGPLLTCVVAGPSKPRRVLVRDISVIAALQLSALFYATWMLWNGRPLYYAFSENVLQLVQAYDIDPKEIALGRERGAQLLPHWYDLPRWIWVPLPQDEDERGKIIASAISGGDDVISMPRFYKPWDQGLAALRTQLRKPDDVGYFSGADKRALKTRMQAAGYAADQPASIPLTGRGRPLLAVFDPTTLKLKTIFKVE